MSDGVHPPSHTHVPESPPASIPDTAAVVSSIAIVVEDPDGKPKDTIDGSSTGSRLHLPPPAPSERFFQPVAVPRVAGAAAVVTEETSSYVMDVGRRDVVTPPVGTAAATSSLLSSSSTSLSTIQSLSMTQQQQQPLPNTTATTTTPQLSPSTIASLRGISSPSNSQVSVGSANPALLNSVLSSKKHYDLTPVTRNTSNVYCDAKNHAHTTSHGENLDTSVMTITPSSQQDMEGYLHGEHLAFPSDLSRATASSGPAMPPLQRVAIHRRNSKQQQQQQQHLLETDSSALQRDDIIDDNNDATYLHMDAILPSGLFRTSTGVNDDHTDGAMVGLPHAAVQFPSRKYYSFTTREQYEEACRYDPDSDDDLFIPSDDDDDDDDREHGHLKRMAQSLSPRMGLIPYAPDSRPANFDIEQLPEEELKRIFISRDGSGGGGGGGTSSSTANVYDSNQNASSSFDLEAEHQSVTQSSFPSSTTIPFGPMRIPSLHMANQLRQDSTTSISYTDQEDEDSIVVRINTGGGTGGDDGSYVNENDDASLSSFGSNVSLQAMVSNNNEICGGMLEQQDDMVVAAKLQLRQQRKRKQRRKKEQEKAMEWLQSVEAHPENDIAEAASSKFLTTTSVQAPYYYHHHHAKHRSTTAIPLQRQMSVPTHVVPSPFSGDTPLMTNTHKKAPPVPNDMKLN